MGVVHITAVFVAVLVMCCSASVVRNSRTANKRLKDILQISPYVGFIAKEQISPSDNIRLKNLQNKKREYSGFLNLKNDDTGNDVEQVHGHKLTSHICCSPQKWEASAYLYSGNCYYDANNFFAYFNGTGRIAFDGAREISYIKFDVFEFTPLQPGPPETQTMTVIKDYKNGIWYQIFEDGTCNKENITHDQIEIMCIPDGAKLVSHGTFGGSTVDVSTYEFDTYQGEVMNRFTVQRKGSTCQPIVTSFSVIAENPNVVYNLDVIDLKTVISDPSIFTPPPSCNEA